MSEVAVPYGVSRQSVYTAESVFGGRDRRVQRRLAVASDIAVTATTEAEALVCELRRAPSRWGARRIVFEAAQRGTGRGPSRATAHRVLVRNGLVVSQAQQYKRRYRRWQWETPMALWQLNLVGGIYLTDGRGCKVMSRIDDHSWFVGQRGRGRGPVGENGRRRVHRGHEGLRGCRQRC